MFCEQKSSKSRSPKFDQTRVIFKVKITTIRGNNLVEAIGQTRPGDNNYCHPRRTRKNEKGVFRGGHNKK